MSLCCRSAPLQSVFNFLPSSSTSGAVRGRVFRDYAVASPSQSAKVHGRSRLSARRTEPRAQRSCATASADLSSTSGPRLKSLPASQSRSNAKIAAGSTTPRSSMQFGAAYAVAFGSRSLCGRPVFVERELTSEVIGHYENLGDQPASGRSSRCCCVRSCTVAPRLQTSQRKRHWSFLSQPKVEKSLPVSEHQVPMGEL